VKYVLDTNTVIAALNGKPAVRARLATLAASDLGIPVVVFAELFHGARRSARSAENLGRIRALASVTVVLPVEQAIGEIYGIVRASVESRGLSKSDFDLVIACTALHYDAILVTHDGALKDGSIEGLVVEDWLDAG
jgi:tRNA(fMet)-specific endonuclease VapC